MTKYTTMNTHNTVLKTYRTAWWVGLALLAVYIIFIIGINIMDDNIDKILELLPIRDYDAFFDRMAIAITLLIPLTYLYMLIWLALSTDWYIRKNRDIQITTFDKIRWLAVLLILIMSPIIIIDLT